ncbi:MAG: DUF3422 family protein [Pseudomonadota bacterium]
MTIDAKSKSATKATESSKTTALSTRPTKKTSGSVLGFPVHSERALALGEIHARPAPVIDSPRSLIKLCFITEGGRGVDQAVLAELSRMNGTAPPVESARHHRVVTGKGSIWWERHTEASTYLWEGPAAKSFNDPVPGHPFGDAFPAPGSLLAGVRIDILKYTDDYESHLANFDRRTLCCSITRNGLGIVATDFRQDEHGLTRMLVFDKGMAPQRLGATAQRLFDIEIYRTLALLGLPLAQRLSPRMRADEDRLTELTHRMRGIEPGGAEDLLDEMTGLAAELEADAASSLYRFGASRAYNNIVEDRLEGLEREPLPGYDTFAFFLEKRLAPAMRTCRAIEERQANLSRKLARAANLLRTRIDVEVEKQNRNLLQSMDRRAKLQLRLQQTVEGLSVAAVSYYVVGLVAYILGGIDTSPIGVSYQVLVAASVPIVVVGIWMIVRRIRRKHSEKD